MRLKNEIPILSNLATTTALTGVENKMPNLVKKQKGSKTQNGITTDHNHDKYITT